MSISLLLSKSLLVPTGGALAAGVSAGGAYYVYSTHYAASSVISTNTFLARVKANGTGSTIGISPLKCLIGPGTKEVACKVSKFTSPKTNNAIIKFDKSTLQVIATPTSDLVASNYVVVELTDSKATFKDLKNKTITLKDGSTQLAELYFDQLLVGSTEKTGDTTKEVYSPIKPKVETYIVSAATPTTVSADSTITGFRCKYSKSSGDGQIENVDDSCKLVAIPSPSDSKKITTLDEVKATTPVATPITLTANSYYKLTINQNLLYNLDFQNSTSELTVSITASSSTNTSSLTLHQQLTNEKFIGKTDLLIAKFVETAATSSYTGTDTKCSFNANGNEDTTKQFTCKLHTLTPKTGSDISSTEIAADGITTVETLTPDDFWAIKFTAPKNIEDLSVGKTIYVHGTKTDSTKVTHKFEIKNLLSGSIATGKKPFIIA